MSGIYLSPCLLHPFELCPSKEGISERKAFVLFTSLCLLFAVRKPNTLWLVDTFPESQLKTADEKATVSPWGIRWDSSLNAFLLADSANNNVKSFSPSPPAGSRILYKETSTVWQVSNALILRIQGGERLLVAETCIEINKEKDKRVLVATRKTSTDPFTEDYNIPFTDEIFVCRIYSPVNTHLMWIHISD